MKSTLSALILALGLPLGQPALADMGHSGHASAQAATSGRLADGTVKKVNKDQGKLTIRHGPLENLDMPPMTMIFRVQDPALLDRVKPGDNIRFQAEKVNGKLTATQIEVVQ